MYIVQAIIVWKVFNPSKLDSYFIIGIDTLINWKYHAAINWYLVE